jgi:hypothetical protein
MVKWLFYIKKARSEYLGPKERVEIPISLEELDEWIDRPFREYVHHLLMQVATNNNERMELIDDWSLSLLHFESFLGKNTILKEMLTKGKHNFEEYKIRWEALSARDERTLIRIHKGHKKETVKSVLNKYPELIIFHSYIFLVNRLKRGSPEPITAVIDDPDPLGLGWVDQGGSGGASSSALRNKTISQPASHGEDTALPKLTPSRCPGKNSIAVNILNNVVDDSNRSINFTSPVNYRALGTSVCSIWLEENEFLGSGFFITTRHFVTCYHNLSTLMKQELTGISFHIKFLDNENTYEFADTDIIYPNEALRAAYPADWIGMDIAIIEMRGVGTGGHPGFDKEISPLSIFHLPEFVNPKNLNSSSRDLVHVLGWCELPGGDVRVKLINPTLEIIGFAGWEIFYSSKTFAGMCGGPVVNASGKVIGIHRSGCDSRGENYMANLSVATGIRLDLFIFEEFDQKYCEKDRVYKHDAGKRNLDKRDSGRIIDVKCNDVVANALFGLSS